MKTTLLIAVFGGAVLATASVQGPAHAQVQPGPAWRPADPARPAWSPRPASTDAAHGQETARLRAQADRNQDTARANAEAARRSLDALAARRSATASVASETASRRPARTETPAAETAPD